MFYQSKRLFTFLHKSLQYNEPKKLPLGFELLDIEGQDAKEIGPYHHIVRAGNLNYLVLGDGKAFSSYEQRLAAEAKAKVADWLLSNEIKVDISQIETVKQFAFDILHSEVNEEAARFLAYLIAHDTVGYGPFSMLLDIGNELEEIEVNAPSAPIRVFDSELGDCQTNIRFSSEQAFRLSVNKLVYKAEKELGASTPVVDAQVENARIHAQIKPYAQSGGLVTIRLRRKKLLSLTELLHNGTVSAGALAYLWLAVECGMNIIVSGAPASGKTTLLNTLLSFVPSYHRTVVVEEDINEIEAGNSINNIVALYGTRYGKVSVRDQTINALRLRPDRIVIGELRGEEAKDVFASANLGMPFMATMHSNEGAYSILKKLMVRPMAVDVRSLSMLDLALYMKQVSVTARSLYSAYEFKWLSRAETETGTEIADADKVAVFEPIRFGKLNADYVVQSKVIAAYAKKKEISQRSAIKELARRQKFLEGLKADADVYSQIQSYEAMF